MRQGVYGRSKRAPTVLSTAIAVALVSLVSSSVGGQGIRGSVKVRTTGSPIAGAVVVATDTGGTVRGQSITDAAGQFVVRAAPPVRLRIVRIGYAPFESGILEVSDTVVAMMNPVALLLPRVHVVDTPTCASEPTQEEALALWEHVRFALMSSVVAREHARARVELLLYERTLDPKTQQVLRESRRRRTGVASRPFTAQAPAAELATSGYMREANGFRDFAAPDADVLLDPSFASTHCFRLTRHPVDSQRVGIGFAPIEGRRNGVDVAGTAWIERGTASLNRVDFLYAGVEPAAARAGAGGTLQFVTAANGVVLLSHWMIRVPVLAWVSDGASMVGGGVTITDRRESRVLQVVETREVGGIIGKAQWEDGVVFTAARYSISGMVTAAGDGRPVPGAPVRILGAADSATADATGRFEIGVALEGRYQLLARDPKVPEHTASFGRAEVIVTADAAAGEVRTAPATDLKVAVPGPAEIVATVCPRTDRPDRSALVLGSLNPESVWISGAELVAEWMSEVRGTGGRSVLTVATARDRQSVDSSGTFTLCGVPRDGLVRLQLRWDGMPQHDTTVQVGSESIHPVRWHTALTGQTPSRKGNGDATTSIIGAIRDPASGSFVSGVSVVMESLGRHALTNTLGQWTFADVPNGRHRIALRKIGYAPADTIITVDPSRPSTYALTLGSRIQVLDSSLTLAQGGSGTPAMRAFEERRLLGHGHFLDEHHLRQRDQQPLYAVILSRMPGLTMVRDGSRVYLSSTRSTSSARGRAFDPPSGRPKCWVTVYLDGRPLIEGSPPAYDPVDFASLNTHAFAAAEFYAGGATVPAQFNATRNNCGTLLLWTRER